MKQLNKLLQSYAIPFGIGVAHQKYLDAEDGIREAFDDGCTHWYIDGSLIGNMVQDWSDARIRNINMMIREMQIKPIFHGNFKAPLASDVSIFRDMAISYSKQEIDICSKINAPLIIHGGCIVEPKKISQAKSIAIENYLISIRELSEYAYNKGVDIYLENLSNYKNYRPFHYIFTNISELDFIMSNIYDLKNIYLFLDVGHANICDGNPLEIIEKYHGVIKGMSFSNNDGIRDQHLGINDGTLVYKYIVETIINNNWKGLIAFEARNRTTQQNLKDLEIIYLEAIKLCGGNVE